MTLIIWGPKKGIHYYKRKQNMGLIYLVCLMVFNATFNNISVIPWRSCSFIDGGNWSTRGKPLIYLLFHVHVF